MENFVYHKNAIPFYLIIVNILWIVCAFGTYFEFRLIIEKNKNYVPFNEVKQEMSMISEVKEVKIG